MRLFKAEAQVLSIHDLQEADRIVSVLTSEHGRVRGVAKGSKRKFSRFAAPLHPLAKVQASWAEKQSDLVRFSSLDLLRPADGLHQDLETILYASYVADQAETFAQEGESAPDLYRLLDRVVTALLAGGDRAAIVRYFELWVLRLAGLMGEPAACASCGKLLEDRAAIGPDGFVCGDCGGDETIGRQALGFIVLSRRRSPENLVELQWPAEVLAEVEAVCATIRRRFLNTELRSYSILKQLLQESP